MNNAARVERLERLAAETAPREVERIVMDAGDGYRIDVAAPAGTLARIMKAYGERASDEPTR